MGKVVEAVAGVAVAVAEDTTRGTISIIQIQMTAGTTTIKETEDGVVEVGKEEMMEESKSNMQSNITINNLAIR